MPLLVIYNPVCGHSLGQDITEHKILPLLASHDIVPDKVIGTQQAMHAGTVVVEFLNQTPPVLDLTVILVSGDGTIHEIANALYERKNSSPPPIVKLVLIPGGTANALHSSLFPVQTPALATDLSAIYSFLAPSPRLQRLAVVETTFQTHNSAYTSQRVISLVVTSTSLHASILHDAEALRASVPGLNRFKLAATQNATTWYKARLRLLPSSGEHPVPIFKYDPQVEQLIAVPDANTPLELAGPFSYMLATVNVDRLEPTFRVTPLQRSHPPSLPMTMDVVIIRPHRDPSIRGESDHARESFKDKLWEALSGAYQDGAHIKIAYSGEGGRWEDGKGDPIVEYFRVTGWEWIPDENDERARLVCADGQIFTIPKGGKAVSRVLNEEELGFCMFAYS